MGLLDEAIREHLELKRRRGGDPSVIAREEREALTAGLAAEPTIDGAHMADESPPGDETSPSGAPAHAPGQGSQEDRIAVSAGSQETAELDMQAAMEDDPDAADPAAPEAPFVDEPALAGGAGGPPGDDSLEWELQVERDREPPPEHIPGQERLSFE